jgi:uncharacterized protein
MEVTVKKITEEEIGKMGIKSWPIWTKEVSEFDWYYDSMEMCYILEGKVKIKTKTGEVTFGKDDFVTFPKGLSCKWIITEKVKKHYQFE